MNMNLFCFTLAGSTESVYEAAYSQTLKDVLPKYQCSASLMRCEPQWGGSDPSITSNVSQNAQKSKRNSRRSCLSTSAMDNETLEIHSNHICWTSSGEQEDASHQNKETCEAPCQLSRATRDYDRTHQPAQDSETTDAAGSTHTKRRLKKSPSLVKVNKGRNTSDDNDRLADVLSNNNPVLTCMGLGKRSEKSSVPPQQQQQHQTKHHEHSDKEQDMWSPKVGHYTWSPFECSQPWSPFYTNCHQPQHELHVCGATSTTPRTADWNRFESLMRELDVKQPPPQIVHSIADLSQNTMTRFGRFDAFTQHSPLMKAQDDGSCLVTPEQNDHLTNSRLQETQTEAPSQRDRTHTVSPAERAVTAITNEGTQMNGTSKQEAPGGRALTQGHRKSSLESLYSLKSGQSSSSGVTSGSDWSSNRGSLRLEEEDAFCGRARVHTEHTPSPYDTESLKLKVGDVIDIIAKRPMGIWTGMLNGKIGNFKFIYVDVLREENPERQKETQTHKMRHGSTVQEVLKLLRLEEFSSSLQRNGYQTVEDLLRLRQHHLTELNVTDPEHGHRLLAAVHSLRRLRSERQLENEAQTHAENTKCSRDSGCPDNTKEDVELLDPSQQLQTTAS